MGSVRQYLIAVTAAAIICGIAKSLWSEKTVAGSMLRMIAGIIMTLTVLSPVVHLKLSALPELSAELVTQANSAAAIGEEMAAAEINAIIKEQVRAYILDKAAGLGASLDVEVTVAADGSHRPEEVILRGKISPYAKARLQSMIAEDIQIAKENQQWIG